jgi:energy-converting hydrogenase Eha subunit B
MNEALCASPGFAGSRALGYLSLGLIVMAKNWGSMS